jgi:effector-binding domain-containing protein
LSAPPAAKPAPHIVDRTEQPYLGVARAVTNGVPAAVDSAFPELFEWLGARSIAPAGPPFIRILEIDHEGEPLELEVAVPVGCEVFADGPVRAGTLPAGAYVTFLHVGAYRSETETDLGDTRARLLDWADEHGISFGEPTARGHALRACVDHLLVSPDTEPDYTKWETELAYLVVSG